MILLQEVLNITSVAPFYGDNMVKNTLKENVGLMPNTPTEQLFETEGRRVKRIYKLSTDKKQKIEFAIKEQLTKLVELDMIYYYTGGIETNPRYLTAEDKKIAKDFVDFTTVEIVNNRRYKLGNHTDTIVEFKHPETGEIFDLIDFEEILNEQEKVKES